MSIDAKRLEALRAEHGPILELSADGESIVCKPPSRADYKRCRAELADDRKKIDALENLTRSLCVEPSASELLSLFDRKPALGDIFGAKLLECAGASDTAEVKKL